MNRESNFDENLENSQMDSAQPLNYLKALATGRDPKTGRYLKNHSGNTKGRPPVKTTLEACLNKSFSRKATVKIDGKTVSTTNIQLACDIIVQDTLSKRDLKGLIQLLKAFGSKIDISSELPKPKEINYEEDPSVQMIKNAIYDHLDRKSGTYRGPDNENRLGS